jgi:hypothetical protein
MHSEKCLFPYIFITSSYIFQMETGELGLIGKLVVSLVEMGHRLEHETVTLLLLQMVACPVLGQEPKVRLVMKEHVLSVSIIELQKELLQSFHKF